MRIGVLGTGAVGQALAGGLVAAGHDLVMGARSATNETASAWAAEAGAAHGSFADAAGHGDVVVNATNGLASLAALDAAGGENLAGKTLVDVANALDFSVGFPPRVGVGPDDSLAEQIQRAHPEAAVVKALNTMNNAVMVDPGRVPGEHHVFLAGDDDEAKATVGALLGDLGWPPTSVRDLGGLVAARGLEQFLLFWLFVRGAEGTGEFNVRIVR